MKMNRALCPLVAIALIASPVLGTISATAGTVKKPSADFVSSTLKVMSWHPLNLKNEVTMVLTSATLVAKVEHMINTLPVISPNIKVMCPANVVVGPSLNFSVTVRSAFATSVSFVLGGCPSVWVYQHGKFVRPVLGGPNVWTVSNRIDQILAAHGVRLN